MNSPADYNPYEAPEQSADPAVELSLQTWRTVVRRFRQETHALAGFAICFAGTAAFPTWAALLAFTVSQRFYKLDATSLVVGLLWGMVSIGLFVLGLQVARKRMWAVRVLMILVYASLALIAGFLLFFGTIGAGFAVIAAMAVGFVAAQCHRVIRYSRILTAAGIPLHTKPHEITLNHLRPTVHQSS